MESASGSADFRWPLFVRRGLSLGFRGLAAGSSGTVKWSIYHKGDVKVNMVESCELN